MTDATQVVLTDAHAHGIARHFLSMHTSASAEALGRARREFEDSRFLATRKGVRRLLAAVHRHLDGHAWLQESWTDRHESQGTWLIAVFDHDELAVLLLSVSSHKNRPTRWQLRKLLGVPLHAIARGHQRLHDDRWTVVEKELKLCALHSRAVHIVSSALGLKQFGIPAFSGLLVGSVEEDHLQAATYLTPPFSRRYRALLDAWMRFSVHGQPDNLEVFTGLTMGRQQPDTLTMLKQLGTELTHPGLRFLASPHQPGIDHVGAMWDMARAQING